MKRTAIALALALLVGAAVAQTVPPGMALIPAGSFAMGDHHGFVDPKHGGDETPVHNVRLDAFYIGINDVTTKEFCDFLNAALAKQQVTVRDGGVYLVGGNELLAETRGLQPYSSIGWDGKTFSVLFGREKHPVVCIRWEGAAAYCNWLSTQQGLPACYDTKTWACDFGKSGYRLPTEAEWEYAARGGQNNQYRNFPWGDDADPKKANWPESDNPYRFGPGPWTTPVGFFDGRLHRKADLKWPGAAETYQTADGKNGYGLYDMSGNVWQFVNDWYSRDYYANSPTENPPGPATGSIMPDGKPYRGMRGGNWFNGENGHGRVSNRNPSYYRGPEDPNHPYYHLGFRVALPVQAEKRQTVKPTPEQGGTPPARPGGGPQGNQGNQGNQGGGQGRPGGGGARLLPPGAQEQLGLTAEQLQQLSALEAEAQAKLDAILTPEQKQQMLQARPGGGRGGGGQGGPQGGNPNQQPGAQPQGNQPPAATAQPQATTPKAPLAQANGFVLRSSAVADGGVLPAEYTGDGAAATLPLEWSGAPAGTQSYAVIMHHLPPDVTPKTYWVLYNLPATTTSLPKNAKSVGVLGLNTVNSRAEYAPPLSKGPGEKTYILTVYALSAPPQLKVPADQVTRDVLLAAIQDRTLASAQLNVKYSRPAEALAQEAGGNPPQPREDQGRTQGQQQGERGERGQGQGQVAAAPTTPPAATPTAAALGQTVGLFKNTPQAYNGYTLMAPKHNTVTYLIDNEGRVVHQWKSQYEPGQSCYLLPNGHMLRAGMVRVQGGTGGGEGGAIQEFDWDGNLVWEFVHATPMYQLHHDIKPLPNGHVLALMVERKSYQEALAVGFDPQQLRDQTLVPDAVVEIEPTGPKSGRIVWEWHVWDHLIQDRDRTKPNFGDVAAHPELIDVNCNGRSTPAFWNHMNSLAYNEKLDQIVLSVRGCNEIWIIDHSTTTQEAASHAGGKQGKGGDLLYRWGNPAAYRRGTEADKQLIQQHDAEWVPDGYPGAGHITIFNNGYERGWSSLEEIVPPVDANGRYTLETGKAYGPEKPVWHYQANPANAFYSSEISGAHRLPNGNTLVCAGVIGTLFEITPAGEVVWKYVNPMVRGGILAQGETPGKDMRGHSWNAVFKVHRYAPDDPALKGRDLTPGGVIELPETQKGKTGLDNWVEPQGGRGGGPGGPPQPRQ